MNLVSAFELENCAVVAPAFQFSSNAELTPYPHPAGGALTRSAGAPRERRSAISRIARAVLLERAETSKGLPLSSKCQAGKLALTFRVAASVGLPMRLTAPTFISQSDDLKNPNTKTQRGNTYAKIALRYSCRGPATLFA
jgi:hypothetical protein